MASHVPSHWTRASALAGAAIVFCLGLGSQVKAQSVAADASIIVLASHYVYRGVAIDDLDLLERTVMPRTPRSVALDACGPAAARTLMAAAQRFRYLALQLRVLDENQPACAAEAGTRVAALGMAGELLPRHIDDEAVRIWWSECRP